MRTSHTSRARLHDKSAIRNQNTWRLPNQQFSAGGGTRLVVPRWFPPKVQFSSTISGTDADSIPAASTTAASQNILDLTRCSCNALKTQGIWRPGRSFSRFGRYPSNGSFPFPTNLRLPNPRGNLRDLAGVGFQYRSAAELLDFSLFRAWSIAGTKYSMIPGRTDFENRQALWNRQINLLLVARSVS